MPYDASASPPADGRQALFVLHELISANRALAAALHEEAARLQDESGLSIPERALLLELRKCGPLTVPDLARRRAVSRQFVQVTVNPLLAVGSVVATPNPAHRRSPLMSLTPAGVDLIRRVMRREGDLMQELAAELSAEDLRQATEVLGQVTRRLAAVRRRTPGGPTAPR